ncbi:MAG: pirin family protein [Methylococcales bacterium]|nr:pirin family protein [Methylococcales bacterium]
MNIQIIQRNDLSLGGFACLKEHCLIVDKKIGENNETWDGIGHFVYWADAQFLPKGETGLHPHKEVDVISIMVEGCVIHEGSLEQGKSMHANQVQVQRVGGEGFEHNEINPDDKPNRMLQLWVLPETEGEAEKYKFYNLVNGKLMSIYGGNKTQNNTLDSHTIIEAGILNTGQKINSDGQFIACIIKGAGELNTESVIEGDLVRVENLDFMATTDDVLLFIVKLPTVSDVDF